MSESRSESLIVRNATTDDGVESTAIYSPCERYRFYLRRRWAPGKLVAFIGLNPSTATELVNDPTVKRCVNYARKWGFGGMLMLNAFAYRSTDPKGLNDVDDPRGEHTDLYLAQGTMEAAKIICCWGVHAAKFGRHDEVRTLLKGTPTHVFKLTKGGFPNHPLYLKADLKPELWT